MTEKKHGAQPENTNAVRHGAYSFRDHGEAALDKPKRTRFVELQEQVKSRSGVLELMQEQAANTVLMCEIITSFIAKEHRAGIPLTEIPILNKLAAFQNSSQRSLRDLLAVMPKDSYKSAELERLQDVILNGGDNGKSE